MLLVCGGLRPDLDGVADYTVRLAVALRGAGATVRILGTGPADAVPGARSVGARWSVRALLAARRAARGADVVHVQFAPSAVRFRIGIGLLPAVVGRPVVTTLHEAGWWRWERRLPPRAWAALERAGLADRETLLLVPGSRAVAVTNAPHAAVVRARSAGHVEPVVIPIGANIEVGPGDRSAARRELGIAQDAVVVAFFGFVHPVKGVRWLGEAVAALAAEGRDVHLLVVGGFESLALPAGEAAAFRAELEAQLRASGAAARTTITGFRPAAEVSRLLSAADVGALPFTAGVTGKSGSLLVLAAHGLPLVVTAPPDGDDPDLVDGGTAVVVRPVRDGAALAAGLRRLLDDRALAERLAAAERALASARAWPGIADAHLRLYGAVLR